MKISAMFLPQFHADPFNSEWWGEGFTEWNNVCAAKPIIHGQVQPRVPLQGYFDLCDIEELEHQARQARQYGISAFTFYDYWYEGKQPLAKPLQLLLKNPHIDIEFSLCWANHSWTRSWTNRTGALDVLISQAYAVDEKGKEKHFRHLAAAFSDPRYIRLNGRPLIQIYDPLHVPPDYLESLRNYMADLHGLDIHIDAIVTAWRSNWDWLSRFDSCTLFQPSAALFSPIDMFGTTGGKISLEQRIRSAPLSVKKMIYFFMDKLPDRIRTFDFASTLARLLHQFEISKANSNILVNPMTFVDFDNTPRYRGRARIMTGYETILFEKHLRDLIRAAESGRNNGYLFINAWNEWGEGAHLQPDKVMGFQRLQAVLNAKS